MGDWKPTEAFIDSVFITAISGLTGITGLTPTCYLIRASTSTRAAQTVTELGNGWYKATCTPTDADTWLTEWAVSDSYTIHYPYKMFKVGGGIVADNNTALTAIQGTGFTTAADSLKVLSDNIDLIKTKTNNLPTDPADDSDLDAAIAIIDASIGDPSGDTLTSLTAKIGDSASTLITLIAAPIITYTLQNIATVHKDSNNTLAAYVSIANLSGVYPTSGEITAPTITISRIRASAIAVIVNAASMTAENGGAYYSYDWPNASWGDGDKFLMYITGGSVTKGGRTVTQPPLKGFGAVTA
jgi:hypothetical protein